MPGCGVAAGRPVVERRHGKAGDRRGDVRRDNPCHRARVPGETLRRSVSVVGCGGPALVEGRRWALNGRHNNKMPSNGGPMLSAHSKDHVDCVSRVLRNAARLPQAPVPTPILDSWRRSMEQHRLDPGSLQGRGFSRRPSSTNVASVPNCSCASPAKRWRDCMDGCAMPTTAYCSPMPRGGPSTTVSSRPSATTAARPGCTSAPAGRKARRAPAGWPPYSPTGLR